MNEFWAVLNVVFIFWTLNFKAIISEPTLVIPAKTVPGDLHILITVYFGIDELIPVDVVVDTGSAHFLVWHPDLTNTTSFHCLCQSQNTTLAQMLMQPFFFFFLFQTSCLFFISVTFFFVLSFFFLNRIANSRK